VKSNRTARITALRKPDGTIGFHHEGTGRRYTIYPAPDLFEIHAESFPTLSCKDAESAMKTLLPTLLPGKKEDYCFDVIARRIPGNGVRAVGLVLRTGDLRYIRSQYPYSSFAIPAAAILLAGKTGTVRIRTGKEIEGYQVSSNTAIPEASPPSGPLFVPADEGIKPRQWHFFIEQRMKTAQRNRFITALLLFTISALTIYTGSLADKADKRLSSFAEELSQRTSVNSNRDTAVLDLADEKRAFAALRAASPDSPYALLSALSRVLPQETDIESLVMKGSDFTIRGTTPDALDIVHSLESLPSFTEPRLERVLPVPSGNEQFTLSGRFNGR